VFYFQQLLKIALSVIDSTSIISTVTNIAYGILLVGFLIGLYQAVMRGGDVQALGVTAIKYLVVAIIIANWATVFRDVNNSFNNVAQFIGNSSGAGDMFLNWFDQLGQQFTNSSVSLWDLITGDIAALIGTILIVVAYLLYAVAIILFVFFYALYGSVLYVLGPMVLALLPISGVGQLGKSFATNLMLWNAWGIIYAVFGALITAIQVNQVTQVGGGGFLGFLRGPFDSLILGLVSIFYAISVALIPFIARKIISGDAGSTAMSMVKAATNVVGMAVAGVSGFAAGASGGSSSTGATSSAGGGGAAASTVGSASTATATSSTPPPPPSVGQSIRDGIASAVSSNASPGSPGGDSGRDAGQGSSSGYGHSGRSSGSSGTAYRPQGVGQSVTYQAARALGKAAGRNNPEKN